MTEHIVKRGLRGLGRSRLRDGERDGEMEKDDSICPLLVSRQKKTLKTIEPREGGGRVGRWG